MRILCKAYRQHKKRIRRFERYLQRFFVDGPIFRTIDFKSCIQAFPVCLDFLLLRRFNRHIVVKCQNLRYLNCHFISIKYAIFKSTRALSHLPVVIASPLHSHHSLQLLFHSSPLPLTCTPLSLQTSPTNCLLPCHFLISTPFNHFHFPLDVFHSLPPNHTNQIAASITQIVVPFATNIITSTFISTCHSFSNFDSTSARLHSTITY